MEFAILKRPFSHRRRKGSRIVSSEKLTANLFNWVAFFLVGLVCFGSFVACRDSAVDTSRQHRNDREEIAGMRLALIEQAVRYAGGAGVVMRGGKSVYRWGSQTKLYDLKSTTKSIGSIALGLAVGDGLIRLEDPVIKKFPALGVPLEENAATGWIGDITYLQLATHTAGFGKPGGYESLSYKPGSTWAYSDAGVNWLADALTHIYRRDLKELLFERVFEPIGITREDLSWRDNQYREVFMEGISRREFGSGISANVEAMVKIGQLFLRLGEWEGQQVLPRTFVEQAQRPIPSISRLPVANDEQQKFAGASRHYGLLWWNNGDGALQGLPTDAFWSWGLYDSLILVIPSLDIVVARAGETIPGKRSPSNYLVLKPFFKPIVAAVNHGAPYPNSTVVANIIWDEASQIVRKAAGSDNWPITWADDGDLYTAYGDGHGFKPNIEKKLSMGFAKIVGDPPDHRGVNIRSANEQLGSGSSGRKASGILMVDGVLYMWVRNDDNHGNGSRLAWSRDHGKNWQWADWSFTEFGYCTFINFERNYRGARDQYIYTVSHDHPNAYKTAGRFVLMRVPIGEITERDEYWFLQRTETDNRPVWTKDIENRGAVFEHPQHCFRSGISYNAGLKRYIWWQSKVPEDIDGRFVGRFGIFDAPEPWGPWTTMYYTQDWDVGAGETGSFPSKWMRNGGKTMHLVFSGDDAFSIRKTILILSPVRKN